MAFARDPRPTGRRLADARAVAHHPRPPHLVACAGMGDGPLILMLHGAGASAHSLRATSIPLLAHALPRLIMPDLPGQGFTRTGNRTPLGLDAMAEDLVAPVRRTGLAAAGGYRPFGGGRAGAAAGRACVPLRPSWASMQRLGKFDGRGGCGCFRCWPGCWPLTPVRAAARSRALREPPRRCAACLPRPDRRWMPKGLRLYSAWCSDPAHVDGTLAMMAQWQLDGLLARAAADRNARAASDRRRQGPRRARLRSAATPPRGCRQAEVVEIAGLGHLVHEEAARKDRCHLRLACNF